MTGRAGVRSVVCGVVVEAVDASGAAGIVVLEDWTPEGELVYEWLVGALGEDRVWREASVTGNVQGVDRALLAHPASKTTLLLGGALPRADLFPLGDLYGSQVAEIAGGWTVPAWLEPLLERAGGAAALDAALARLVDGREPADSAVDGLDARAGTELVRMYDAGRWFRLRPRLVPKLGARTIGVDLFD